MNEVKPALKNAENTTTLFPLLLGQGKLARHLHHYLHLTQFPHRHFDNARDLKNPELLRKLRDVNSIWILTRDQSIASVASELRTQMIAQDLNPDRYTWIHSSAATEIPGMHTLHPLMSFSHTLYSLETYQSVPFAVISSDSNFASRFPLPNPHFSIPAEKRAFYHACAVMMSNLPVMLWSAVCSEFTKETEANATLFHPILKQTLSNFIEHGEKALTGPIARGDLSTIEKNLAAIQNTPLEKIYSAFLSLNASPQAKGDSL